MSALYTSAVDRALLDKFLGSRLAVGETVFSRDFPVLALGQNSGIIRYTFFTPMKTEPITGVRTNVGTAAATVTLSRIGIYTVDANGDGTLVASTANNTSLWTTLNAETAAQAFSVAWNKVAGQRYAVGDLFVGTTAPQLVGLTTPAGVTGAATIMSRLPRIGGSTSGLTDLPGSFTHAALAVSGYQIQHEFVP